MSKKAKFSMATLVAVAAVITFISIVSMSSGPTSTSTARFGVASVRASEPVGHIGNGAAAEAIEKAGNSGEYVFAVFYREDNEKLTAARDLINSAKKKISRKSETVEVNITDQTEQDVVKKYGANRAQLPLVLVLAPNGAIMGGFPTSKLTDDSKLVEAVGCPASEQTLKALQQKSMVALCMQNKKTSDNAEAMQGVEEFLKDPKYGPNTAVVMIDPSDEDAAKFVSRLGLDPTSSVATTALLAPPGTVIGTYQGATTADKFLGSIQAVASAKSGCGAGGCAPGQSCGPAGASTSGKQQAMSPEQMKTLQATTRAQLSTKGGTNTKAAPSTPTTTKTTEPAKKQSK